MKRVIASLFLILCSCCFFTPLKGQESITTTGGNVSNSGGSVSYTIGQILYSTISGTNGTVSQGVQQPYEFSVVTSIENIKAIYLECIVYPNPTKGVVKLVIESFDNEEMRYRLYDINGLLLQDKKIESRETEILMDNLPASMYLLKVTIINKEVKVFKIIKN